MKKFILLFVAVAGMITLQSCEGPEGIPGPPGAPGAPGLPGESGGSGQVALAVVYEVNANLNAKNDFSALFSFSTPLFDSDNVLVYRLKTVEGGEKIWEPLPRKYYLSDELGDVGEIDYLYNFSKRDFFIKMEFSLVEGVDVNATLAPWGSKQVFRAVVIPSKFGDVKRLNATAAKSNVAQDYQSVMDRYQLKESDVIKL